MLQRAIVGTIAVQPITWLLEDGSTLDLRGKTISGTIQPVDSPADLEAITGALAPSPTPADAEAGQFTWTYATEDVDEAGLYLVQFKAVEGVDSTVYSFATYWIIEPSEGIHPYSLAGLRLRLMETVSPSGGSPTAFQYTQAIKDAISEISRRIPMRKQVLLSIVGGTATYNLPTDFIYKIILEDAAGSGQVGYSSSGKLIAFSNDFCQTETYYINGRRITFVPDPMYSMQRRLWYAAGYTPDEDGVYQDMTEEISRLVLLKAQAGVLHFMARTAASQGGLNYQFGDVKVDKKGKAESLSKTAVEKESEFESGIRDIIANSGMTL